MTGAPRSMFVSLADLSAMGIAAPDMDAPTEPFRPGGQTYVMQRQGWVKIGRSTDLRTRHSALRGPNPGVTCPQGMDPAAPLVIVRTFPENIERDLHKQFAQHHVIGEWFTAEPVLAALEVLA